MNHPTSIASPLLALTILGSTAGIAAPMPACKPPARVVERFIAADCTACWAHAPAAAPKAADWVLDWIAPAGTDAALSAAALPEAAARLEALGGPAVASGSHQRVWPMAAAPVVRLRIAGGPAWNGYLGLELRSRGKPPKDSVAYVALVEVLPAGQEGSAIERRLLRAVAGPLVLEASGRASSQLRALRVPPEARPERLVGVAWWVDGSARLRGMVTEGCPPPAR